MQLEAFMAILLLQAHTLQQ